MDIWVSESLCMDVPRFSYDSELVRYFTRRYVLELDDADVYRLPYLDSSDPGFCKLLSKYSVGFSISQ